MQVCRDLHQSHHPISGLLLVFGDEHIESLGQVRWDFDLSQDILTTMYVDKGTVDERNYIKDICSGLHNSGLEIETGEWQILPIIGTIVGWFGHIGDKITTYDE